MSSRAASRIVVGVGLAVVFGIGVSIIMEQGAQNQAANNPPTAAASSDQIAVNPPAADAMASLRNAATAPPAPSAVASPGSLGSNPPDAANQAALNSTNSATSGSNANESSASSNDTNVPKPKHGSHHAQSIANVEKSSAPPNDSTLTNARGDGGIGGTTLSSPPAVNDAVASSDAAFAPNAESKPASEHSSDGSGSGADTDGQIAAQVRSSIASLAPGSNIDVKAISGIVALAGSVPSQDVVQQARQAAQHVPGVKQVDTSALMVQNQ